MSLPRAAAGFTVYLAKHLQAPPKLVVFGRFKETRFCQTLGKGVMKISDTAQNRPVKFQVQSFTIYPHPT